MADRVLREQCEHGRYESHYPTLDDPEWASNDERGLCPGGREVTIDIEKVAAVEHDQWAHWTAYMFANLERENVARWRQQIDTPYAELTEAEKDSDREWANKAVDAVLGGFDG